MTDDADLATQPRWGGKPGRLEVWYATATDRRTGTGLWIHSEVVAPVSGEPYAHGWAAVFPRQKPPSYGRFGPGAPRMGDAEWLDVQGVRIGPKGTAGTAEQFEWELAWEPKGPPLWTFPRWAWRGNVLPASQVVPYPSTTITGKFTAGGESLSVDATGAVAHIYGHGNAERWAWLHADLGDGAVVEVVTAVSRRPGMRRLPPLAFVALRRPGSPDWPRDSLACAPLFRTRLDESRWTVTGVVGRRRLRIDVRQPDERNVSIEYTDPDGAKATCTNTERADVVVSLERWSGGWRPEHKWECLGTAHAEVGTRP